MPSPVSCTWNTRSKVSPGSMGHSVIIQPVVEPAWSESSYDSSAHSKPVPEMSVVPLPSGQPLNQQHSDAAVLMAM